MVPVYEDPAMWIQDGHEGESLAETFQKRGIPMMKAENDRIAGKMQVHTRLRNGSLLIHRNCSHLIRTLPLLVYDKIRVEDVNSDQEDHAYDELRYGLMVHRAPTKMPDSSRADYLGGFKEISAEGDSWLSN